VKEDFWAAHVTFDLLHPTGDTRFETWNRASTSSPGFEFAMPSSWSAEPVASRHEGISGVNVRLIDKTGKTLIAYLQVRAQRMPGGRGRPRWRR
jgi:hypothetical protein